MTVPLTTHHSPLTPPPGGEPYVPLRKEELIDLLVRHGELEGNEASQFRKLCQLIETIHIHDFHQQLEHLKRLYAPFDPDAETQPITQGTHRARSELLDELLDDLAELLTAAHYRPLTSEDLDYALSGATYWGLDLQINREIFDRLMIYVRGDSSASRVRRDLSTWFRRRVIDLQVYQRVVLVVKLRPDPSAGDSIDTDGMYLKMFREIPKLDLEMLLPGTLPRIRWFDAGKIGGSSVTGIFSLWKMAVEYVLLGKLKWLMVAIGTLAYAFQSFLGYHRTKAAYLYSMTQQLYYQNLDNNAGVFCRLIDEAHDEETKEAILAYYFLWQGAEESWTPKRLAEEIEKLLRERTGDCCQFQTREAIAKLERLNLLTSESDHLRVVDPAEAMRRLSERWKAYLSGEFEPPPTRQVSEEENPSDARSGL